MIKKINLRTPRRFDENEIKLYGRSDVEAKKQGDENVPVVDELSAGICEGLGGKENISDVDCCATRLRITVHDATLVNDSRLRLTGASGVVHKGNGVQIIYGPKVTVIKSNFEDYLESGAAAKTVKSRVKTSQNIDKEHTSRQDNKVEKDKEAVTKPNKEKIRETIIIASPMTGTADKIENAPDEAFSGKMMGDGAVVTPSEPIVMSPADGVVSFVFDTKHALGIHTDSGLDIIVHVGIDTVKLNGKGFEVYVKGGDRVKKGDNLIKLDLKYLNQNAPSMASPVLCTEMKENQRIRLLNKGNIHAGEELFAVDIME